MLIAAKLIGEIARDLTVFESDAQLARLGACAPIPISSGRTDRHRLDPGGNRQLNHAIHMLALTKISHDPQTALYIVKQRARGKTTKEAIRSLKRYLIRRVYNLLKHHAHTPATLIYAWHLPAASRFPPSPLGRDNRAGARAVKMQRPLDERP